MNEENQNEAPQTPSFSGEEMKMPKNSTVSVESDEKTVLSGPVILVLAILLILVFAGIFMWYSNHLALVDMSEQVPAPVERPTPEENNEPESTTAEAQTDNLEVVSTSDEIAAIEADIEATDLEALDAELEAIEAELDAAI